MRRGQREREMGGKGRTHKKERKAERQRRSPINANLAEDQEARQDQDKESRPRRENDVRASDASCGTPARETFPD